MIKPASARPLELSFWNLVEGSVLAAMRRMHGVSLQTVRPSLRYVSERLGVSRPLIQAEFVTDGVDLFVERYGQLIAASEAGQIVIRDLRDALRRIDRDPHGLAAKLYPWTRRPREPRVVSIDPSVAFGRPTLIDTGVPIESIMERFRSGDTIERLAADYRVSETRIENALRWVAGGAAAA